MRLLSRQARRLIPADWRETVERDLVEEASRKTPTSLQADLWLASQFARIGMGLRWHRRGTAWRLNVGDWRPADDGTGRGGRRFRSALTVTRDAWRALRTAPATTSFAILILTVAIAAATVTFSVVDAVVLRSLPFEDSERIVLFGPDESHVHSGPVSLAWRDRADTFAAVAATDWTGPLVDVPPSDRFYGRAVRTTASLFDVLQVRPIHGRLFSRDDEVPGREGVAVIGHDLWQRGFGADPAVIGRPLRLVTRVTGQRGTRETVTLVEIIGVLPRGFSYPLDIESHVWIPLVVPNGARAEGGYLSVVGRLREGTTLEQATAQVSAIKASVRAGSGFPLRGQWQPTLVPLRDRLVGDIHESMLLVLLAAGLLMVIACVNVANLMLARAVDRARALAVRASLGASPRQLGATLLAESLMLSLTAAAFGILLAYWGVDLAKAVLPAGIFRADTIAVDRRVLAVAVAAAVAAGVFFGLVPAWHAARVRPGSLLNNGSPAVTSGYRRWREIFLVAEIALVGAMLVVSTLFVASFVRIVSADLGFGRSGLLAVNLEEHRGSSIALRDALRAIPGIASVAESSSPPPLLIAAYRGSHSIMSLRLSRPGDHTNSQGSIEPTVTRVSSGYLETAGIRVVQGRGFNDADAGRDVAIIDEQTAGFLFPDRSAVGAYLPPFGTAPAQQIVGVTRAVVTEGPDTGAGAQMYWPMTTGAKPAQFVLIRLAPRAGNVIPAIQAALQQVLPAGTTAPPIRSIDEAFRLVTAGRRAIATLMSIFGLVVVLIGAAGVYAVMASVVVQQRREFGVRVALGATRARIVRGVVGRAAVYLTVGLAFGLAAGRTLSTLFVSMLFEVRPTDASTYAIVTGLLMTAGLLAALRPAMRAAHVDPIVTLRAE